MPAAGSPLPAIQVNKNGSVTIEYVANQSGAHELNLSYNEDPVEGTPFRVNVDASTEGSYVSAYGAGLVGGRCGEKLTFNIARGGKNNEKVDVSIDGPSATDIFQKEGTSGVINVDYLPTTPGEYNISIKCKGKHIHGSPFASKISGEGHKKSSLSISTPGEYILGGNDVQMTGISGYCKAPESALEPIILKRMPNGKLAIASFQPKKKGTYTVNVSQDETKFPGSPFQIQVGDAEVCNAKKVKTSGAIKQGTANEWNEVKVNVADAGFASMVVTIDGSEVCEMSCKQLEKYDYLMTYRPPEPGIYLLSFRYGGDHISGSPFMVTVGGKPSGRVRETVSKQIQAGEPVIAGQDYSLDLVLPGATALDTEGTITSPSGRTELCEVRDSPSNLFTIKFTPTENGVNILSLKQNGIHIAGSPLPFSVGKPGAGGRHKIEFGGVGVQRGSIGIKNEFNIYTREAGPGILTVSIEGPSKAQIVLTDRGGFSTVSYIVQKDGEYSISVKYDDEDVPRSPCKVKIDPESKEAKKITVHALCDRGLQVDKPATFSVNLNGVTGTLKGYVDTPSGNKDDLLIQEIDNEMNSCRFLPKENGVHYVHVKFNDVHIPGSPFPMLIGKLGADPALVQAQGSGLENGETGEPCKFIVTTANAGSGLLSVSAEGTSKIAVLCTELEDGYEFSYTPTAPGDYLFTIKYCNVNLAGSPFKATISGKGKPSDIKEISGLYIETTEKKPGFMRSKSFMGDASKVIVQGAGLKKGFVGKPGNFTIEIKEAGQAVLRVANISPSGTPVKEYSCKKVKPGSYTVSFMPEEKGDHLFYIFWGPTEVPGSPFVVSVS